MSVFIRPSARLLLPPVFALLAVSCSDRVGMQPLVKNSRQPQALRWAAPAAPRFTATRSIPPSPLSGQSRAFAKSASTNVGLEQDSVTFWAVRGEERSVQINYLTDSGDVRPFLQLTTSDPVFVPGQDSVTGGDSVAVGDSVLITVTVDPQTLKVSLQPTGLQFGTPSQLQIWYDGAGRDLNGDGVVDSLDTQIEQRMLGVWYREGSGDAWTEVPADQSIPSRSFLTYLKHFCEYGVSWLDDYAVSW